MKNSNKHVPPGHEDELNNIAIDFDGVIHTFDKGFHDGTCYGKPIKGTEEADYMNYHQDLIKQGQTAVKHPDFDIDWAVDNLLINNDAWKIFVSDKIGGVYFLQEWMAANEEALMSGQIADDMLHPDSFDPNNDTRLHKHYADRLKMAFDPSYMTIKDGNTSSSNVGGRTVMSEEEKAEADELIARVQPQPQQ